MSTYTKEQFLSDVKAEAVALRQHATKEELGRLDLPTLYPDSPVTCIYGQMTHDCRSLRATELIQKCCQRYFTNGGNSMPMKVGFAAVVDRLNEASIENLSADRLDINHFSSIETYIFLPDAQNANLISYLRGETDDLNL